MLILKTETVLFDPKSEYTDAMEYKTKADPDVMMAFTNGAISFTKNQIIHIDIGKEN